MYTSTARSTATCTRREADARAWKAAIGLRPVEVPSGSSPERTPLRDDRPPRSRPPPSPPADLGTFTPTKIRFPTQWADSAEIARAERKAYTRERNRWAASLNRQQVDVLAERLYADARQRCDCGPTALPRRPRSALARGREPPEIVEGDCRTRRSTSTSSPAATRLWHPHSIDASDVSE